MRKREKSFIKISFSDKPGTEISEEYQDSPLLAHHNDEIINNRLEDIQDLAPFTLHQTLKCTFKPKLSRSLKEFSPEMNGILKDVVIDMNEANINHYDQYSLQNMGERDINLLNQPNIQAQLLPPGSSDANSSDIIVGDLILDDTEEFIMIDNELKFEDLEVGDPNKGIEGISKCNS